MLSYVAIAGCGRIEDPAIVSIWWGPGASRGVGHSLALTGLRVINKVNGAYMELSGSSRSRIKPLSTAMSA